MMKNFIIARHYVPYHLGLNKGSVYKFKFFEEEVVVIIHDNIVNAQIEDLSNNIIDDKDKIYLQQPIEQLVCENKDLKVGEKPENLGGIIRNYSGEFVNYIRFSSKGNYLTYRRKYYTSVLVISYNKEAKSSQKENNHSKEILKYFLNSYEYLTKHLISKYNEIPFTPKPIDFTNIKAKSLNELIHLLPQLKLQLIDKTIEMVNAPDFPYPRFDKAKVTNELSTFLSNNQSISIEDEMLLNSYKMFHLQNYKFSFLESFFALEIVVSKIIYQFKLKNGVSKKMLYKSNNMSLEYKMKVDLRLILLEKYDTYHNLMSDLDHARKMRNDIVHKSSMVSKAQTEKFNDAIKSFITKIKEDCKDYL